MLTTFRREPAKWIRGQLCYAEFPPTDIQTRVAPALARAKIVDYTFAGTWAPADTATVTLQGIPTVGTLQAGDDTITEARDRVLAALQAATALTPLFSFAAQSTNAIRVTGKELVSGSGQYLDYSAAAAESTAGNGTMTAAVAQAYQAAANIPFGVGLARLTSDAEGKQVTLPAATGFVFAGVALHTYAVENRDLLGDGAYPAGHPINAIMKGYVAVVVEQDVTNGDPVYLRHTASGSNTPGGWRKDADTANADLIVGARWETGATAGNLAVLYLG